MTTTFYIAVATTRNLGRTAIDLGVRTDDAHAIWGARIERNGRANSAGYYGGELQAFELRAFRGERAAFSDEITRALYQRAVAGDGELIALP